MLAQHQQDEGIPAAQEDYWQECLKIKPVLLRVAARHCSAPEEPEDVVHDAMIRAAEFTQLDLDRLRPFLVTVVKRLCADHARHNAVVARLSDHPRLYPRPMDDPAESACDRSEAHWLAAQVRTLSAKDQALVRLVTIGLQHSAIAQALCTTPRATQAALYRIRRRVLAAAARPA